MAAKSLHLNRLGRIHDISDICCSGYGCGHFIALFRYVGQCVIPPKPDARFSEVLAAAIEDLSRTGFVSQDRLNEWITWLRNAAERDIGPTWEVDAEVRKGFTTLFERFVDGTKLPEHVPGIARFTKENIKPRMYPELDRRITAAADLIKYNRQEAINTTLRRFSGWATSIPPGGDDTIDKRDTRSMLGKELREYRYHKRLVANDQGHKLIANVANIVATDAGAIAGIWNSHGHTDKHYNARKTHLERDGKIYLIRDSWAHKEGLVKPKYGYTDDITAPGQEVNCRCWLTYITSPRKLPDEMLTKKGQRWIEEGKQRLAAMGVA